MSLSSNVSYSRLSTFLECQELFRRKYVIKEETGVNILEEALIKGSLAHMCIEEFLRGSDKEMAISLGLSSWLRSNCNIDSGLDEQKLEDYAKAYGKLLMRTSEGYFKSDKLRTKDGKVLYSPIDRPSKELKDEYDAQELYLLKRDIDNQAARLNTSFVRISLANIAAQAVGWVYLFELPEAVEKVKEIELDFADKKITFCADYFWNGKIDTVYETKGKAELINDHKSEKNKRRPEDILYDLQLNSYGSNYYDLTGKLVDYLSITHLPTNSLLVVETDAEIMNLSMDYLESIQNEIDLQLEVKGEEKSWLKKWPGKYGSPCLRRNWLSEAVERVCPYIRTCHPEYYNEIKQEVDLFLGLDTVGASDGWDVDDDD